MIRYSEAVLAGHPDKFCDQIADRIIAAAYEIDPDAYAQVEVATWSDQIWLNGGIVTRTPFEADLESLITEVGIGIGYCRDALRYHPDDLATNCIDVEKYRVSDAICKIDGDPTDWTRHVNDQAIVIGWAGYDEKVHYLPPEHFLAHTLREALDASFLRGGLLEKQGPDGKLLVRLRENVAPDCRHNRWEVEEILVTVQQREETRFGDLCEGVAEVVESVYATVAANDSRWQTEWRDIHLLINPNGPLLNGGSDGDNGQTGRKLVMDYYGPRVPLGGGALSGKDLTHVDRAGAYAARKACVESVAEGAGTCEIAIAYAPGRSEPLDVRCTLDRRVRSQIDRDRFTHQAAREVALTALGDNSFAGLGRGGHFFSDCAAWNAPSEIVPLTADFSESQPTRNQHSIHQAYS